MRKADGENENGRASASAPETIHEVARHRERTSSTMQEKSSSSRVPKTPTLDVKAAEACLAAGYELIPLHSHDNFHNGKSLGKTPKSRGWRLASATTRSELREHMAKGGNVGVRLRAEDLVIDVDPRNGGDQSFKRLLEDFPFPDDAPKVITGTGGTHVYLRKPAELEVVGGLAEYPGIDFKKLGGYVVAAGSIHPDTKQPYHWDPLEDNDLSAVPAAPEALLAALKKHPKTSGQEAVDCKPEQLEALLRGLDPSDYSDYLTWLKIGMAAHHATGGSDEGMEVFAAWSERDPVYEGRGDETRAKWPTFSAQKDNPVTLGTIFHYLDKTGNGALVEKFWRRPAEEDFADEPDLSSIPVSSKKADLIDQLNDQFCAVLEGGKFVVFMEDLDHNFRPPRPVWMRLSRADFLHWNESRRVRPSGSKRDHSVAEVWLASPRRRQYSGIVLDPDGGGSDKLNLWKGWAVKPKPGDWSLMRELIEKVLCSNDPALADYVIRWMAFMFQRPGEIPGVAIAFRGEEGTGKGTLGRALMDIAGAHGLTVSSTSQFAGRFNAHLRTAAFLFADEVNWRGNREAESVLKQLVTEPTIAYEGKGANIVSGRNLVHLMLASNNEWIVPAGPEARRFVVSDVSDERRGDEAFFAKLNRQMREEGGLEAMFHDLLAMDLGRWRPSHNIPKTKALAEQKALSLEPAAKFWVSLLDKGVLPVTEITDWEGGPIDLSPLGRNEVLGEYDRFLKANRLYHVQASHKALVSAGRTFGLLARRGKGGTERLWALPPLAEARRRFEESLGGAALFGD
jgi:hypothetical protein